MLDTAEKTRELKAADRCDSCNAQAFVRITLPSGRDLLFCGHDYAQHESALKRAEATVDDQRHLINAVSASSA